MPDDDNDELDLNEQTEGQDDEANEGDDEAVEAVDPASEAPYRVVAADGTLLSGYPTREDAQAFVDGHAPTAHVEPEEEGE